MRKTTKENEEDCGPILPLITSKSAEERPNAPASCFAHKTRFLVVGLAWLCLSLCVGNSLTLNFTVICMTKRVNTIVNQTLARGLKTIDAEELEELLPFYDAAEQAWLFSAIAVGCLVGAAPISALIARYGTRAIFTIYGFISGISMLLMPLAVYTRIELVFFMRFLQGIGASTSFVMMGTVTAEWAPWASSGAYLSFVSTHLQMSKIIAMPTAGLLCESEWGWPVIYYVQGVATILLFVAFFAFYRDSAAQHPFVSSAELSLLQRDKVVAAQQHKNQKREPVPYRQMLTDWAVLGAVISLCGGNLSYQIFAQFGPTYLSKVLGLNVGHTGITSAVPAILCIGLKLVVGPLSDRLPLSARGRVIFFASLSQWTMSACFVVLAFLPSGRAFAGQLFFTLAYLFSGLNVVGVIKSCQLISGRFVHFIMALNSLSTSFAILLLPPAITHFAPSNSREEWTRILVFIAVFCCIVTLIFDFTAEGEPRPWVSNRNFRRSCSQTAAADKRVEVTSGEEEDVNLVTV
ncbi:hypothetical protein M3Y99_01063100 [Aphelenchoides fujianensis]|nr:hypothetical protein M3Y99_01063100 [Aphelenchoides fujianensis]